MSLFLGLGPTACKTVKSTPYPKKKTVKSTPKRKVASYPKRNLFQIISRSLTWKTVKIHHN